MKSIIPKRLKEELEDVTKVYNSKSGMYVYPNALSRLQGEITKVCNLKVTAEENLKEAKDLLYKWVNLVGFKAEKLTRDTEQFLKEIQN